MSIRRIGFAAHRKLCVGFTNTVNFVVSIRICEWWFSYVIVTLAKNIELPVTKQLGSKDIIKTNRFVFCILKLTGNVDTYYWRVDVSISRYNSNKWTYIIASTPQTTDMFCAGTPTCLEQTSDLHYYRHRHNFMMKPWLILEVKELVKQNISPSHHHRTKEYYHQA